MKYLLARCYRPLAELRSSYMIVSRAMIAAIFIGAMIITVLTGSLLWGNLAWMILWPIPGYLDGMYWRYHRQLRQAHWALHDPSRIPANPQAFGQFVALCHAHGDIVITLQQARSYGMCWQGLSYFRRHYLDDKKEVKLSELYYYIEYSHKYWRQVYAVVYRALQDEGWLLPRWYQRFEPPTEGITHQGRARVSAQGD